MFSDQPVVVQPLILVTGLSGAGKSTALRALEDMGYHSIDNLPLPMIAPLVARGAPQHIEEPLAIGVDIRSRAFSAGELEKMLDQLSNRPDLAVQSLLLDARDDVLVRRFSETRRPHPLRDRRPLEAAIAAERALLAPLYDRAVRIDSSALSSADMRALIRARFALNTEPALLVFCQSFGFAHGLPAASDMVMDVRFLKNPHYDPKLRPLTGLNPDVAAFIRSDPAFSPFRERLTGFLDFLLPHYMREGKAYLTLAFGCTGGKHRSVMVSEEVAAYLRRSGYSIRLVHRDKPDENQDPGDM